MSYPTRAEGLGKYGNNTDSRKKKLTVLDTPRQIWHMRKDFEKKQAMASRQNQMRTKNSTSLSRFDWFLWHINLSRVILRFEVRESYSLYVHIYHFV